jgi:hypothetical protein
MIIIDINTHKREHENTMSLYMYILSPLPPRSHAEPLATFCGTMVENGWSRHFKQLVLWYDLAVKRVKTHSSLTKHKHHTQ